MYKTLTALSIFTVLALHGCVPLQHYYPPSLHLTPPPALNPEISAIGIVITERKMESVLHPDVVYFAKVDEVGDLSSQRNLMVSNFSRNGHNYLLNVPPGRYIAVALGRTGASYQRYPIDELTFFPKEMIRQTETIVSAGEIKSMGTYEISHPLFGSVLYHQNDGAQRHYFQIILPDTSIEVWGSYWRFFLLRQRALSATNWKADRSVQTESIFLDMAYDVLTESGQSESWSPMIQHRREALINAQ